MHKQAQTKIVHPDAAAASTSILFGFICLCFWIHNII